MNRTLFTLSLLAAAFVAQARFPASGIGALLRMSGFVSFVAACAALGQ